MKRGCPSYNSELLTTVPFPLQPKAGKCLTAHQARKQPQSSKRFRCVNSLQRPILETRKWRSERMGNWPRVTLLVRSRAGRGAQADCLWATLLAPPAHCLSKSSLRKWWLFVTLLVTTIFVFVSGDSTQPRGVIPPKVTHIEGINKWMSRSLPTMGVTSTAARLPPTPTLT